MYVGVVPLSIRKTKNLSSRYAINFVLEDEEINQRILLPNTPHSTLRNHYLNAFVSLIADDIRLNAHTLMYGYIHDVSSPKYIS